MAGQSTSRPNLIVIMSDHHRADTLGAAGHPVVQTPNLDRLAAEGVRFARAYCQGPVCLPARTSFLTERYVRDHGVDDNDRQVPADTPTFARALQQVGYHTACIGKTHVYAYTYDQPDTRLNRDRMARLGIAESHELPAQMTTPFMESEYTEFLKERGLYETYCDFIDEHTPGGGLVSKTGRPRYPVWQTDPSPLPTDAYVDTWVGQRTVRWLDQYSGAQPFFLWVGFPGPHNPWDAPAEYVERYRNVTIPLGSRLPPEVPDEGPLHGFLAKRRGGEALTEEVVREVRRFFYANVTLIDEQVGAILATLERQGRLDNTWIVYTSDHGEMLGDHLMLGKVVFYEPSVSIPLLVRPAGGMRGAVVEGPVQHIDIGPTLRALADAQAVPDSDGQSLVDAVRAPEQAETRPVVYSENFGALMVRTARHKLVVDEASGTPMQLFDLEADPDEDRNLVDRPEAIAVLSELMTHYVEPFLAVPRTVQPPVETRTQVAMGWVPGMAPPQPAARG